MKKIETVFLPCAFLPHEATKREEKTMPKILKNNHSKSTSCKKIKKFGGDFPISGNLPYVKGNKKYEKFSAHFHFPGGFIS